MSAFRYVFLLLSPLLLLCAEADQPIMNMMPRWDGGFGVQVLQEFKHNSRLLDGKRTVASDLSEDLHIAHLQGVYTWDRSVRLTVKIPYLIEAEREVMRGGERIVQRDSGLGDATVALPLKKYFNEDGYSGSWTFAPQVRVPLDHQNDDYEFFDGAWGNGLSLGYEVENFRTFFAGGVSGWTFYGDEPTEWHAHIDLGLNFLDRGQALIETDYHAESDGTRTLMSGPALYWRFTDLIHSRIEYKQAVSDDQGDGPADHGDSQVFKVGLGFVY